MEWKCFILFSLFVLYIVLIWKTVLFLWFRIWVQKMEKSEELRSILPYLPLLLRSSSLVWPSQAAETLKELAGGRVDSGHLFFQAITDLRKALSISSKPLSLSTSLGYALFFDEVTLLFLPHFSISPFQLRESQGLVSGYVWRGI